MTLTFAGRSKTCELRPGNTEVFCARWTPSGAGWGGLGEEGGERSGKERRRREAEEAQEREAAWGGGGRMSWAWGLESCGDTVSPTPLGRWGYESAGCGKDRGSSRCTPLDRASVGPSTSLRVWRKMGMKPLLGTGRACEGDQSFPQSWSDRAEPGESWPKKIVCSHAALQALGISVCPDGQSFWFLTLTQALPMYCHSNWPFGRYSVTYLNAIIPKHQAS